MNGLKRKSLDEPAKQKKKKKELSLLDQYELETSKANKLRDELNLIKNAYKIVTCTNDAIDYMRSLFKEETFNNLPPIIYLNQVYSLFKNRTEVDRDIESMRLKNEIRLFKADSKEFLSEDLFICYTRDLKSYVQNLADPTGSNRAENEQRFQHLKDKFVNRILNETFEITISREKLMKTFGIFESDLTSLVQMGLFAIKDSNDLWFSVPNIGKFRRSSVEARRKIVNLIRNKRYKEISVEELIKRNHKDLNDIGLPYLYFDLVGSDIVKKVDSPLDAVIIQLI